MTGPKGYFGTKVLRIPRDVTNRVAELEMGREVRGGRYFWHLSIAARLGRWVRKVNAEEIQMKM